MHKKIISISVILFIRSAGISFGQEMLGTVLGNYSGVNGIQLNPSSIHNSKTYLDVQLLAADVFVKNNYLYISRNEYRFSNFFKAGYQVPYHDEEYGTGERPFYHYTNTLDKNAFLNLRINGPGAMLIWGRHGFAITTALRTVVSMHNVPYDVTNFSYLGLNYLPQQDINYKNIKPFSGAALEWGEIGLSYSYMIMERGFDELSAGISVRKLFGSAGFYASSRNLDYFVPDDSTMSIKNIDVKAGLCLPVDYNSNQFSLKPLIKGGGFGFDFGITYKRLKSNTQQQYLNSLCEQKYRDYIYRVGISLIDIGAIRFRTNAINYHIDNRSSYWDNLDDMEFQDVNHLLDTISWKFYGDYTSAYSGTKFLIWLPSALSLQFDYHYMNNWYINACLVYGFNLSRGSLIRPTLLVITPRYETSWLETNIPVTLYDWRRLLLGLSIRIYGFTIGTENLGGYFHFNDFTGLDFYCSIKFFLEKGKCLGKTQKGCIEKDYRIKSKF